jgi:predicted kinase
MDAPPTLIACCGKMAAGKSTLARTLVDRERAVLLEQDAFVAVLLPGLTTDAEFDLITAYVVPSSDNEGFTIVRHQRA